MLQHWLGKFLDEFGQICFGLLLDYGVTAMKQHHNWTAFITIPCLLWQKLKSEMVTCSVVVTRELLCTY
jgi:hypothetical protein